MTRWINPARLLAAAFLLLATTAGAQTTTGTIRGHVQDGQGLALPGVVVTATSTNLQGERSAVTSETGDYLLSLLPSGAYTLTFELNGFERASVNTTLAPMQDNPVDVTLGLAGIAETVTVTAGADVAVRTAQVATNFSQDLISALPTTRDVSAVMLQAPSVHATGPSGAFSIAGSPSFESQVMVNGVTVNENLRGAPLPLYIEDAIQETVVAVSGVSAEYGRFSGGLVNVITQSGGNEFSGSFRDTYNNDRWRALTPFEEKQIAGDPSHKDVRIDESVPTYEYTFGGPVLKDRLWFFTAGRLQDQTSGRTLQSALLDGTPGIPYIYSDKTRRYEGKGTYSATPNHRIQANLLRLTEDETNYTFNGASTPSMDLRSLGTRQTPQNLYGFSYNGILSPRLALEARFSARQLKFVGNGAKSRDRIEGTTIISMANNGRFWSDTFCGVCEPERRSNADIYAKASYFLSTRRTGTHNLVFGVDSFDDIREANNHQTGSDFRLVATGHYLTGSGADAVITPQFLPGSFVQYSPITEASRGADFRTHSLFFNDTWRVADRLTATLGVRWDKNHGVDQAGQLVAHDGRFSPRFGVTWDPSGSGKWTVSGSVAKYVAAIANTIADVSSPAGNPTTYLYLYTGPAINADGPTVPTADAIRQVLDWYDAADKSTLTLLQTPRIPGLTTRIADDLASPYAWEYTGGVSREIGPRFSARADVTYRRYHDFYAQVTDGTTGQIANPINPHEKYDLTIVQNTDLLKRRYAALLTQASYRVSSTTQVGGQYTLSRTWGNFDGETVNGGPSASDALQYPEYKQASWSYPEGDLQVDQRHRARLWATYGVPGIDGLSLSAIQTLESGVPYSASNLTAPSPNGVNPRPYVSGAPTYMTPPTGANTIYFFSARDAFRTEGQRRTDFAANYDLSLRRAGLGRLQFFAQAQVINLFNQAQLCGCGASVFSNGGAVNQANIETTIYTAVTNASTHLDLQPFNPFLDTPVEGVNWVKSPAFGTARNRFAYTSPRQFRFSIGLRF